MLDSELCTFNIFIWSLGIPLLAVFLVIDYILSCEFQIYTRKLNFTSSSLVKWVFSYRQKVCFSTPFLYSEFVSVIIFSYSPLMLICIAFHVTSFPREFSRLVIFTEM